MIGRKSSLFMMNSKGPNGNAIADMALENFVEMKDKKLVIRDFFLKKLLNTKLKMLFLLNTVLAMG